MKAKILAMKVDQKNIEQSYSSTHPACQVQQAQPFWRQRNTKCGASVTATGMEQRDAHGIIDGTRGFYKLANGTVRKKGESISEKNHPT